MKLSVIIPAYNELDTIEESIARVKRVKLDSEIIVVDDCSTDGTRELLQNMSDIKLVPHVCNMGKGMAIRTALQHVTGDIVIIQDADLEYDPEDFHEMVEPIVTGKADVVYGSRFLQGKPKMNPANYLANRILAITASILFGARITDEATCYKAFRADLIKGMNLTCTRFEFCPEVTAKVRRSGYKIVEVPIRYTARTVEHGKKIGAWDGVVALWTLIKYRFVRIHNVESQSMPTIYIYLMEEGSDAWRPTQGEPVGNGLYRVLPTENYDPEDEVWEFPPGSIVRCEVKTLRDTRPHDCLVAVERVTV